MAFAHKRLLRDLAEVQREPSELVAAAPLEDNLFEWHANLRPSVGPLAGIVLHLRIVFPEDYPASPPNMLFPFQALPSFVHPNLYSFGLCLDILQSYIGQRTNRAGWSTSYTVRTILLQLQSFLFEFDAAPQDHGGTYSFSYTRDRISRVRAESAAMSCSCGHCGTSHWPPLMPPTVSSDITHSSSRPSLSAELRSVRVAIAQAEARIAEAQQLPKEVALVKRTAYLSAGDEPRIFRAAVPQFCLRVVRVQGERRSTYVRTGFSSESEKRSPQFFVKSTRPMDWQRVESGSLHVETASVGGTEDTWAVLLLRNVQVCVETLGCQFWEGAVPREASQSQLRRQIQEQGTQSAELLPTLQTREQHLLQLKEQAARQQQRLESFRLQAAEEDLVKPLYDGAVKTAWGKLSPNLLLHMFMHLDVAETTFVERTCKVWRRLSIRCSLAERIQLCCFYTKAKAQEDVLGFGITVSYHDDGNIKEVGTELDVISAGAFYEHRVRRGAWGNDFAHLLPLVLDADHARRAVPVLKKALASVVLRQPSAEFVPWMALAVLPQVMNSFVVSLMKTEDLLPVPDDLAGAAVPRHASEKALLGYCSFHHMLLALCARHPEIGKVATDRLRRFIRGQRSKAEAPDLGQLLVYMAITEDIRWEDVAAAVLAESHIRGVRWLLRDRPSLERAVTVEERLRWTFEGRATSLRLLMFQAFFLRSVARPAGESLAASLTRYDRQFGQPTIPQKERLVRACREIVRADGWPEVYKGLGLQMPTEQALAEELCMAIPKSRHFGYHGGPTLLLGSRSAPERVGIKKSLQQAFQEMEFQKIRERAGAHQGQRAPVPPRQARPAISRGGFAALQEDSDEETGSD